MTACPDFAGNAYKTCHKPRSNQMQWALSMICDYTVTFGITQIMLSALREVPPGRPYLPLWSVRQGLLNALAVAGLGD